MRYSPAQSHQPRTFNAIDMRPSTAPNIRKKLQVALHPGLSSNPLTTQAHVPPLQKQYPWPMDGGGGGGGGGGVGRSIGSRSCASKTFPRPIILNLVHPAPPQTVSLSVQGSDHRPSVAEPCIRGTTTDASWIDGYAVTQSGSTYTTPNTTDTISRLQAFH
ncbi:hypothetical protein CFIO01_06418 [Colletotrichum fioriniae PJ7]|uniref:Uncharacterized protein n=1 Tax=Colletotrichum fioriniae PJ7 TaxID=1445577 RepID=A0A010RFJ8_9PEZI|nr:hypothetical protein CFIO01_06418 [Colletotrichum fioriniae PJ7]